MTVKENQKTEFDILGFTKRKVWRLNSIILLILFLLLVHVHTIAQPQNSRNVGQRDYPVVPFNTNFWNYWDHYWITWLDDHPVYEAIELTAYDNPDNPDYKLIRVFLSEKDGNKSQYYYLNDSASVARSQANSFFRDIKYKRVGEESEPQNLYVKFRDKDNQLIEWTINFAEDQSLRKHDGGLTPSVHSVGYVLLYHLRTKTVDTIHDKVLFDGVDYAFQHNKKEGKRSWYNNDVYSAVIIFGQNTFTIQDDTISNTWNREFYLESEDSKIFKSRDLAEQNFIRFGVDEKNQISWYKQTSFGRSFIFEFEPALPNWKTAEDEQIIDYSVSFDNHKNLMVGKIKVTKSADGLLFNWKHLKPEWATWRSFKSVIQFNDEGYTLTTYE